MSLGMFPTKRLKRAVVAALAFGVVPMVEASTIKDNLYGVKALNPAEAVAVGNFGSVYRTADGGKTWGARDSGVTEPLFGVDFSDAKVGWAVGKSGIVRSCIHAEFAHDCTQSIRHLDYWLSPIPNQRIA